MIKAFLFDLDGTLVNTLPLYLKSYKFALERQGFNFNDKKIVNTCFGKTEKTICDNLDISNKVKKFTQDYFSGVQDHYNFGKLFPGAKEVLSLAKEKGLKLAIISFAYRWYVDKMVQKLDVEKYFDCVIGFDDVKKAKPHPEAILLASKKLKIKPAHSLVIGDSKSDIEMGKAAGCQTILFYPPSYDLFYDLVDLKKVKPDAVMKSLLDLKKFI